MFAPISGTVRLKGREVQGLEPARVCDRGLARSFQITNLFEGLAPAVVREPFTVFALERASVFHTGPAQPPMADLDYRKKILWL